MRNRIACVPFSLAVGLVLHVTACGGANDKPPLTPDVAEAELADGGAPPANNASSSTAPSPAK